MIQKELEALKKKKNLTDEEAKEIHRKETTQAKINRLLEEEKRKMRKND